MARYEQSSEWGEFEKHVNRVIGQKSLFDDGFVAAPSMYAVSLEAKGSVDEKILAHILVNFFMMNVDELEIAKGQLKKEQKVACKSYTKDVAETKIIQVMDYIRSHKQPFQCIMKKKQR